MHGILSNVSAQNLYSKNSSCSSVAGFHKDDLSGLVAFGHKRRFLNSPEETAKVQKQDEMKRK